MPYSAEFRERETNLALLEDAGQLQPNGRRSRAKSIEGELRREVASKSCSTIDTVPPRPAQGRSAARTSGRCLLLIGGCVFFADVFVRRVTVSFDWSGRRWSAASATESSAASRSRRADERMERLRSRKAADRRPDRQNAAPPTRFEPQPDAAGCRADRRRWSERRCRKPAPRRNAAASRRRPPSTSTDRRQKPKQETLHASGCSKAKKKVWDDQRSTQVISDQVTSCIRELRSDIRHCSP